MRNFYLLALCLLTFSMLSAQEELSKKEKERREQNIQAGNPFKKFGYKPKIATLSKGKYLEFHDLDSIVKIGSFTYHVKNKVITGIIQFEEKISEATLRPEIISRWFSPDPLSEEFPSWSPYNFVYNNPIRFVDPDGLAPMDIIITGNATAIEKYKNTVLAATGGHYSVSLESGGKVSLINTGIGNLGIEMTAEQKAFYDNYSAVVNSSEVVNQEIVQNDINTVVDNWITGKIDISDVAEFDKDRGAASSAGAIIHSTVEQHEKSKLGLSSGDKGATTTDVHGNTIYTDYLSSHKTAISAENRANGNYRGVGGNEDVFLEKNGKQTQQTLKTTPTGGITITKIKIP